MQTGSHRGCVQINNGNALFREDEPAEAPGKRNPASLPALNDRPSLWTVAWRRWAEKLGGNYADKIATRGTGRRGKWDAKEKQNTRNTAHRSFPKTGVQLHRSVVVGGATEAGIIWWLLSCARVHSPLPVAQSVLCEKGTPKRLTRADDCFVWWCAPRQHLSSFRVGYYTKLSTRFTACKTGKQKPYSLSHHKA